MCSALPLSSAPIRGSCILFTTYGLPDEVTMKAKKKKKKSRKQHVYAPAGEKASYVQ